MSSLNDLFRNFDGSMADFAPKDKKEELEALISGKDVREPESRSPEVVDHDRPNDVVLNDAGRPMTRRRGRPPKKVEPDQSQPQNTPPVQQKPMVIKLNLKNKPLQQPLPPQPQKAVEQSEPVVKKHAINDDLEPLFLASDTPEKMRSVWMSTIMKARDANLDNSQADKVRRGKFRITEGGKLEILPETEIQGKSSRDLCKMQWSI